MTHEQAAKQAVKDAVKQVMSRWGHGWRHITDDHAASEVQAQVLGRIAGMDPEHTSPERIIAIATAAAQWHRE
jgi:hypothetical protein